MMQEEIDVTTLATILIPSISRFYCLHLCFSHMQLRTDVLRLLQDDF